jgi:hypothetical protein
MRCVFLRNWQIRGFLVVARLYRFSRENRAILGGAWCAAQSGLVGWCGWLEICGSLRNNKGLGVLSCLGKATRKYVMIRR